MGFFKSMSDLKKVTKEIEKNHDPGQQLKDSMSRMQQLNEQLATQTKAANLALSGTPARATINTAAQTGQLVNFQPSLNLELTVFPTAGAPYPVALTQIVEQPYLGKAVAGNQVAVKVDPADPQVVWIDWAGS